MKKTAMFILRYISVTAVFFTAGMLIFLAMVLLGVNAKGIDAMFIVQVAVISSLYAATSPISFSVKHFLSFSMTSRLLIQTVVNYPLLISCAILFGWINSVNAFCKVTTVYFFAGIAASLFICIYYPRKYKLYNDGLRAYKKKALEEDVNKLLDAGQ